MILSPYVFESFFILTLVSLTKLKIDFMISKVLLMFMLDKNGIIIHRPYENYEFSKENLQIRKGSF